MWGTKRAQFQLPSSTPKSLDEVWKLYPGGVLYNPFGSHISCVHPGFPGPLSNRLLLYANIWYIAYPLNAGSPAPYLIDASLMSGDLRTLTLTVAEVNSFRTLMLWKVRNSRTLFFKTNFNLNFTKKYQTLKCSKRVNFSYYKQSYLLFDLLHSCSVWMRLTNSIIWEILILKYRKYHAAKSGVFM